MNHVNTLPPDYLIEDGKIVHRWVDRKGNQEEIVADGTIEVVSVRQYTDNPNELFLVVRFQNSNATQHEDVQIPIIQITENGSKLLRFVPDWFALLQTSPTKRRTFLQNTLNLQRTEITEVVKVQREGMGYHFTDNGTLFYILGDMIINGPTDANIESSAPFHLRTGRYNLNAPSGQDVSWVRKFCEQGPPQAALFVAALTSYLHPILEATNNLGRFGVYVCGESGTGKSESAKLLCSIFREDSGATLSSDKTDIFRLMSLYRDLPFLLDDLNNSRIASAMNKKSERLSEILQQQSGSGVLSIRGETFNIGRTTPVITAETLIKSYSTINRTIIISHDHPFNADTMSWLQENHDLYIEFLTGFIGWLCQDHTRLKGCVQSWSFSNLNGGIKNTEAFVGFHRLMRSFKILKIAVELLLLHLREVYAIPKEDESSWRRLLEEGINQAVFSDTLEPLRKENKEQGRFYVEALLRIFVMEKQLNKKERLVAKSYQEYMEMNRRAKTSGYIQRKIFFISGCGHYYSFRGDDLIKYLDAHFDNQYRISKQAVSRQLDYHGLLQRKGGELSYPIAQANGKTRFYHLRKDVVDQMLKESHDKLMDAVNEIVQKSNGNNNDD